MGATHSTVETINPDSTNKRTTVPPVEKPIAATQSEASLPSPFVRSGLHKNNPLDLIRGFEHQPLVSLEEALASLYGKTNYLRNYIREAKIYCHDPSEHGLTCDESAAIYIYTMRWGNECLYNRLQSAWESEDISKMKPWLKYLKLFKSGYDKLPEIDEEIWQGKSLDLRLQNELDSEAVSIYTAMDVFSLSKTFVEQSLSNGSVRKKIFIGFQHAGAKWAGDYVADSRNGALVFPGTKLTLLNMEQSSDDSSLTYHVMGPMRKY